MFTWICPKCGREVPPSESECPSCTPKPVPEPVARTAPAPSPAPTKPPAPGPIYAAPAAAELPVPGRWNIPTPPVQTPVQTYVAPTAATPPPQPIPEPPLQEPIAPQTTYQIPPPSSGIPAWVVGVLVAVGLTGALAAAYFFLLPSRRSERASASSKEAVTTSAAAAKTTASTNPFEKYLEIGGLRMLEDGKQKLQLKFVVVNHSAADLPVLTATVTLRPSTAKPGDDPISVVTTKLPALGPFDSKEVSTPIKSKLRAYEFPDWQFLRAEFSVNTP
jgi:hypothetical protein